MTNKEFRMMKFFFTSSFDIPCWIFYIRELRSLGKPVKLSEHYSEARTGKALRTLVNGSQ